MIKNKFVTQKIANDLSEAYLWKLRIVWFMLGILISTILFKLTIGLLFDPDPPTADDAPPEY
jgi:hypothetical protein